MPGAARLAPRRPGHGWPACSRPGRGCTPPVRRRRGCTSCGKTAGLLASVLRLAPASQLKLRLPGFHSHCAIDLKVTRERLFFKK